MDKLEYIRKYEKKHRDDISRQERPAFHLTPAVGWLNDPNGFSWYKGKYHLYYQYNPYETQWGPMNWGHWTSENLVDWKFEPAAFVPDQPYESGVFSGSAVEDQDGSLLVMYTAHFEEEVEPGNRYRRETQCIARGDGYDFQKSTANPVIKEADLPEFAEIGDFRDPKIWIEDGKYYVILVTRDRTTQLGMTLLFESDDAIQWYFVTVLNRNDGRFGRMWECPDMYTLDQKTVITLSSMKMKTDNFQYRNGHVTLAFVGDYDQETHQFVSGDPQAIDLGFDFYALQSMKTPDGRRIGIGWMQAPEAGGCAPETNKWYGMMSFPREFFIQDGYLYQKPIREIENLYLDSVAVSEAKAEHPVSFDGISGRILDLTVEVKPCPEKKEFWKTFSMKFASDGVHYVELVYRNSDGHLIVDRSHCGRSTEICDRREIFAGSSETLKLRILLDRYSFEIFVHDGAQVLSGTLYEMPLEANEITFDAPGAVLNIEKHAIREAVFDS